MPPGQIYQVSFDAMSGSGIFSTRGPFNGIAFSVQAAGGPLVMYYLTAGQIANSLAYTFTAHGADTPTFQDVTGFDSNAGWIDNVRITAVPESTTVVSGLLLLLPFEMRALRRFRSKLAV